MILVFVTRQLVRRGCPLIKWVSPYIPWRSTRILQFLLVFVWKKKVILNWKLSLSIAGFQKKKKKKKKKKKEKKNYEEWNSLTPNISDWSTYCSFFQLSRWDTRYVKQSDFLPAKTTTKWHWVTCFDQRCLWCVHWDSSFPWRACGPAVRTFALKRKGRAKHVLIFLNKQVAQCTLLWVRSTAIA